MMKWMRSLQRPRKQQITAELTSIYLQLDEILEQEVPLFSLYFMSNSGSVNNRIKNASPTFFGAFNNIQDWEIAQ